MDTLIPQNPLQTVQLIPIFNYFNILSNFLFIENYLTEANQTKQIPVVNALYEYFADHCNNHSMTVNLIRNLLKGSDLYGERSNEQLDVVFVNAMFDYIISSLVFDKFGNIYGFFVEVFRKAENLQIDHVLNVIKESLQSASFENEYGERSTLSSLSVNRIYNEIILPLFPQTERNLSLNCLDYIYAQAGLMFLRLGRINTNYYSNFEYSNLTNMKRDELFDDYLLAGHLVKILSAENKNIQLLKVFALSALSYHVYNAKYLFVYENTANIISDANFWQEAYVNLFQYMFEAAKKARDQIDNDNTFKMYIGLSRFRSHSAVAKLFVDHYCAHVDADKQMLLSKYLSSPEYFECKIGEPLPNLNKWYMEQIQYIIKSYETHDLQSVQNAFEKSLIEDLEHGNVTIRMLNPYDRVKYGDFTNSKQLSRDVLEIYFPENKTYNYYALVRDNYNITLIKEAVNPKLFKETVGLTLEVLRFEIPQTVKTPTQNISEFWKNLVDYKITRLQQYLQYMDVAQGNNETWKNEWWKEFGLSLIPYFPCFLCPLGDNHKEDFGLLNSINFLDKFQDVSTKLIHTDTQSVLSSLGTTLRSVFLENVCSEAARHFVSLQHDYILSLSNALNDDKIFDNISVRLEDPTFELEFMTQDDVRLLEKIISAFHGKTNLSVTFFQSKLDVIRDLKSSIIRTVGTLNEYKKHFIYVKTINVRSVTSYGYKFIFLSENLTDIAYLRTDFELQNRRIVLQFHDIPEVEKQYITLNAATLKPEPNCFMYEMNNQLRSKSTKVSFSGISVYHDDDKCDNNEYFKMSKYLNVCLRKWRLNEKLAFEKEAVKFIQANTNLSQEQIKITLNKYTFPDNKTSMEFVKNWTESKNLQPPAWGNNFIIDNPDSFNILKYQLRLENHNVPDHDGEFRIKSIYSHRERRRIEKETPIKNIVTDYNTQKAYYSATFEDYYAIRNFADTGYTRITGDTNEAKLMKLALHNLAIRQSDDPDGEFEPKLFRVETKPINTINQIFSKNTITLQKFTFASTNMKAATRFAVHPGNKFINVVYEMEFYGSYMRAKIEQSYTCKENTVILLPGSEFFIANRTKVFIEGLGTVLKLNLEFINNIGEKYLVYKKIMNDILQIQF